MLRQEQLIARVRTLSAEDPRVVSALMYGSFARGEGDEHSDVEFYLFFGAEDLARLDREAWLRQVAPLHACFENEYGTSVALFDGLLRGEFHFEDVATVDRVRAWRSLDGAASPERMLLVDRTGALEAALREAAERGPLAPSRALAQSLVDRLLNWLVLGSAVLRRGEAARALDALSHVQRHLLWLTRLRDGALAHWPTPSRALERDLPAASLQRYRRCTASLDTPSLEAAYTEAWRFGSDLAEAVAGVWRCDSRDALFSEGIAARTPGALGGEWAQRAAVERHVLALHGGDPFAHVAAAAEAHREAHGPACGLYPAGPSVMRLAATLVRAAGAKRILDLGCGFGYSTLWLADAAGQSADVDAVDRFAEHVEAAREHARAAGLAERIRLQVGEVSEVVPTLTGPYDWIHDDAWFAAEPAHYERTIALLGPGGVLSLPNWFLLEDALRDDPRRDWSVFAGRDWRAKPLRYAERLAADSRLDTSWSHWPALSLSVRR